MKKLICAAVCLILLLLLILAVKTLDVAAIGPEGTSIGLSRINGAIHEATGVHMLWYKLTNYLGILSILVVAGFALLGVYQLMKRKSLGKVDREILVLGGLYVLLFACYVLFEFVVVNRRPVLLPGDTYPEASFPSSHTMLVFVILGSLLTVLGKYVKNRGIYRLLTAICGVLILVAVFGRLLSGVHWFTDILGGILLSAALLFCYAGAMDKLCGE